MKPGKYNPQRYLYAHVFDSRQDSGELVPDYLLRRFRSKAMPQPKFNPRQSVHNTHDSTRQNNS
jgi:hypothetical protein